MLFLWFCKIKRPFPNRWNSTRRNTKSSVVCSGRGSHSHVISCILVNLLRDVSSYLSLVHEMLIEYSLIMIETASFQMKCTVIHCAVALEITPSAREIYFPFYIGYMLWRTQSTKCFERDRIIFALRQTFVTHDINPKPLIQWHSCFLNFS